MSLVAIDTSRCNGCGACVAACPEGAVSRSRSGVITIDHERCSECGLCLSACPTGAMHWSEGALTTAAAPVHVPVPAEYPTVVVPAESRGAGLPSVARKAVLPTVAVAAAVVAREVLPVLVERLAPTLVRAVSRRSGAALAASVAGQCARFRRRHRGA